MNTPTAVADVLADDTADHDNETEPVWVEAGRAQRLGASVSGLDASAALIDVARRRAPSAELVTGDMFDLPWPDGSFDAVSSFNGIWGGCTNALREARRVLRHGGGVGLTFWGRGDRLDLRDWFIALGSSTPHVGEEMISLASIGTPGVVEEMLATAGFGNIERWETPSILEFVDEDEAWKALRSPVWCSLPSKRLARTSCATASSRRSSRSGPPTAPFESATS